MNRWSRSDTPGRLSRLLSDARFLADPERDEEAAPYWSASTSSGHAAILNGLRARFRNRLHRRPSLGKQWAVLEERLSELESEDGAREHFESVTGHRISEFTWSKKCPTGHQGRFGARKIPIGVLPIGRVAAAACLLVAIAIPAVPGLISRPPDPFSTHTPSLSGYQWDEVGERTRRFNDTSERGQTAVTYADAMAEARRSRTVLFGFVEKYDREGLLVARDMLEEARHVDTGYPQPVQVERMAEVLDSLIMRTY